MAGTKSKQKGKRGEQIICNFFSEVLGGHFQRVPNSGAYIGAGNAYRKSFLSETQQFLAKGDIIPPDHLLNLVIESKNYKDFPFANLMKNQDIAQLDTWLNQVLHDATDENLWFLIFKIDRKGSFIAFDPKHDFILNNYVKYKAFYITEFEPFVIANKDKILELGSTKLEK